MSGAVAARSRPGLRLALPLGAAALLVAAMALDTKVVRIGSAADVQAQAFSPASYGKTEFPKVQAAVESRAVDAATLAAALAKDQDAAAKRYGTASDTGPEFPVRFTGKVSRDESGDYAVAIAGVPSSTQVSLQLGPAIIGTDLRDATGTISFGQFHNQIEYQNAGSALNNEMKKQVLSKLDVADLQGRTVSVVGVFQLTDMSAWQVTPVKLDVR